LRAEIEAGGGEEGADSGVLAGIGDRGCSGLILAGGWTWFMVLRLIPATWILIQMTVLV
jgi:hypothetical protein